MSSVKTLFTGPPKPKEDKDAKKRLNEQLENERKRAESADRALMSARRARRTGGAPGRSGLAYVAPVKQGATLG